MKKTNYTLKKQDSGLVTVFKDGKICTLGFPENESALHSIWVLNGKDEHEFYVEEEGVVYLKRSIPVVPFMRSLKDNV